MYFEFVTPRMLILHPIMSIKVLRNRNLIHDSFDGRVVNVLRAKRFLRNYDYVEPYVERIFDRMLRESLTRRGQFLIDFVKVRFGISKNAIFKKLRYLSTESNRVLIAELNMGLDHITLRQDLNSTSVLELLTK